MTRDEAIDILLNTSFFGRSMDDIDGAIDMAVEALKVDPKEIFYDGYAYCLIDFGKDTVLCKDCKHWDGETHGCEKHPSVEPWWETDSCNYGERKDSGENDS